MNARTAAAVMAGRAAAVVSKGLGRGGGTALPGLVAERLQPALVADLARQLRRGAVLITGTNGKTTTARMLASILAEAGIPSLHNREGSNLMRGLASTLLTRATPLGRLRAPDAFGLFEVDEATLPAATRAIQPRVMVFTNLFRDQLDRYGEVDTVAAMWREALAAAPRDTTLVLNADDPSVAELAIDWPGPVHWFGLEDPAFATTSAGASDARWCRACGGAFAYERRYFAHIGFWRCGGCGRSRATPHTAAKDVRLALDNASFHIDSKGEGDSASEVTMPLTGAYNVYNALAAIATARVLGVPPGAITAGLAAVHAAFGRQEVLTLEGRRLRLMLAKNPAGANQVLRLLEHVSGETPLRIAVLLNDRFADGQDVSWVWDVDYELLAGSVTDCWTGGDRAADIALRLKYARWPAPLEVEPGAARLIDAILRDTQPGDDVFFIPTYTAMLDLRAELQRRGAAGHFWEAE